MKPLKQSLQALLESAAAHLAGSLLPEAPAPGTLLLERTRDPQHGDFTSSAALRLATAAGVTPRVLAQAIVAALPQSALIARAEVAGPGFINLFLSAAAYAQELARIHAEGRRYGTSTAGQGERVLVEHVSADPASPLHVGHGRQGAYGASLARLIGAMGYSVTHEYTINDTGRHADVLAVSAWVSYLQMRGEALPWPRNADQGDGLQLLGEAVQSRFKGTLHCSAAALLAGLPPEAAHGDKEPNKERYTDALIERARSLLGSSFRELKQTVLAQSQAEICDELTQFGVTFDGCFSQQSLADSGAIRRALARLEAQGRLYTCDGAVCLRAAGQDSEKESEKDSAKANAAECVLVRENGTNTCLASDIAYRMQQRERGFSRVIRVAGAEYQGYSERAAEALLAAMGEPEDGLEVQLVESVNVFRGQEERAGPCVTLRQVTEQAGDDACRFFFLMRSHSQRMDFDLGLAQSRNSDNPVFYVQYAHARVASAMKEVSARGLSYDRAAGLAHVALLTAREEQALLVSVSRYPEVVEQAAVQRAPHLLAHYLRELAHALHTYHHEHPWIVPQDPLRHARLALVLGVQQVIRNGLELLGVAAPDSM